MSDFITIAEAIAQKKGDFVGIVTKVGDLKSGTNDKGDWTLKVYIIEDPSGKIEYLAWKESERTLQLGHTYEFINPWYKDKEGKISIQASQYGKINHKDVAVEKQAPAAASPQEVKDSKLPPLPELNPNIADLVSKNTVLMMGIEKEVRKTMREFISEDTKLNDQQVGLYVKENFRDVKRVIPDHG